MENNPARFHVVSELLILVVAVFWNCVILSWCVYDVAFYDIGVLESSPRVFVSGVIFCPRENLMHLLEIVTEINLSTQTMSEINSIHGREITSMD
jgi:hypothetical protein